jgi:phosphate transport system substrate-binding protein
MLIISIVFALMTSSGSAVASEILRYHGSGVMLRAIMQRAASEFKEKEGIEIDLKGKDTIFGLEQLLSGQADITGGGRALKSDEIAKGLVEKKLFLDARAFIVNRNVPIDALSTEQIADILLGKINNWNQISDIKFRKLVIVSPNMTSAHYKNQKKIIGFDTLPKGTIFCERTPDVFYRINQLNKNKIGFLSNSNVAQDKDVKIITIMKNGQAVPINQENVASGSYPYVQSMYFYTLGQPKNNTKKFIEFMESNQGQAIITDAGFFLPE